MTHAVHKPYIAYAFNKNDDDDDYDNDNGDTDDYDDDGGGKNDNDNHDDKDVADMVVILDNVADNDNKDFRKLMFFV